jgi:hypothetical protein
LEKLVVGRAWRIRISKKNRQHIGQKTKHKRTNDDLQIIQVTRTPLNTGGEFRCSGRVSSSCSNSGTRRVTIIDVVYIRQIRYVVTFYWFWLKCSKIHVINLRFTFLSKFVMFMISFTTWYRVFIFMRIS